MCRDEAETASSCRDDASDIFKMKIKTSQRPSLLKVKELKFLGTDLQRNRSDNE